MENLTEIESIALQEMQAGEVPTELPIDQAEQLSELKKMDEEDNILPLKDNDNDGYHFDLLQRNLHTI